MPGSTAANTLHIIALAVSAWMLPWEKRQMDGQAGPLKSWERVYWSIFAAAIAYFLYTRLTGKDKEELEDPEVYSRDLGGTRLEGELPILQPKWILHK